VRRSARALTMASFLFLGFLIGIRHALDADHVAAVMALAARGGTIGGLARQGALWGLGHSLTLLLVAGACILLGVAVPHGAERGFEAAVGAMLVLLGISVLVRLRRRGIDAHAHAHGPLAPRALIVGAVHGLAGSGALVLLVAGTARSSATGLAYVALFGLGSVLGMASLAAAAALPLSATARLRGRSHKVLCAGTGAFSLLLGARMLWAFLR